MTKQMSKMEPKGPWYGNGLGMPTFASAPDSLSQCQNQSTGNESSIVPVSPANRSVAVVSSLGPTAITEQFFGCDATLLTSQVLFRAAMDFLPPTGLSLEEEAVRTIIENSLAVAEGQLGG
jgi:hypothetical protein